MWVPFLWTYPWLSTAIRTVFAKLHAYNFWMPVMKWYQISSVIASNVGRFQTILALGEIYLSEWSMVRYWLPCFSVLRLTLSFFSFKIISLKWFDDNGKKDDPSKSKFMMMLSEYIEPQELSFSEYVSLQTQTDIKHFGMTIDKRLTFNKYIHPCILEAHRQLTLFL